jgi:hypothetical protein
VFKAEPGRSIEQPHPAATKRALVPVGHTSGRSYCGNAERKNAVPYVIASVLGGLTLPLPVMQHGGLLNVNVTWSWCSAVARLGGSSTVM